MSYLGVVTHLQIQRSSLKMGDKPRRYFDPAPLYAVEELTVGPDGAMASVDGVDTIDVHHRNHPAAKHAGVNGLSLGFTSHYEAMRARFGDHVVDGIAGENILVRADAIVTEEQLSSGVTIETRDGEQVHLRQILVAEPCVEYTRYALCWPPDDPSDRTVTEGLQFLRGGMRGFYTTCIGGPFSIRVGDRVYLT